MDTAGELLAFVGGLPDDLLPKLLGLVVERICRKSLSSAAPPAPEAENLWSTKRAAEYLDCSEEELRERVRRGEVAYHQRTTAGRIHFDRADLDAHKQAIRKGPLAGGLDRRYSAPHETLSPLEHATGGGASAAADGRAHAAPTRLRPRCDGDDGGPVGARRARRVTPGRDRPYAPGSGAWAGATSPPAKKGG